MRFKQKDFFLKETRELINLHSDIKVLEFNDLIIEIDPEVFNPDIFFSSQWFAKRMAELAKGYHSFMEIGCGTGIVSLNVKKENLSIVVHTTDLIQEASESTKKNSLDNNLGDNFYVYNGDVFDGISKNIKSDIIFWALPFGFIDDNINVTGRDRQVFDSGYKSIKKFISELKDRKNNNGHVYIGFSDAIGDRELMENILEEHGYKMNLVEIHQGFEKSPVDMGIYEVIKN